MKSPCILTLSGLSIALVSCGGMKSFNQPLGGSSGFDPLSPPGTNQNQAAVVVPASPSYQPGQWVETSMPNATFFSAIPSGNATANKMLPVATPLKVISTSGTYVKVELDSGEVGFVPEIMIAERSASATLPVVPPPIDDVPQPGVLVTPPSPTDVPPPPPTPGAVPPLPDVAPPPEVPGITPPQDVD